MGSPGQVAPPSRRVAGISFAAEGRMPSGQPARCRRYGYITITCERPA